MSGLSLRQSYKDHVDQLLARFERDSALRLAVGGEFIAVGKLESYLLQSLGLTGDQLVVDVGCGSGRLAYQLRTLPAVRYIGYDIEQRLVDYAAELVQRPDWTFVRTDGTGIPCGDGADFVCFFSVFTHLPYEAIYRYLTEAQRVLKPGGQLVLSFLEFRIRSHWEVFNGSLRRDDLDWGRHLNQFLSSDAIAAMAEHAGLEVQSIFDGDKPHIPLPEEVVWENGTRMREKGTLGQSVAVLRKPAGPGGTSEGGA